MAFCDKTKKKTDQPQYFDPLGPAALDKKGRPIFQPTGGVEQRNRIFTALNGVAPGAEQAGADLAAGLRTASSDAGWGQAADLARRTIGGEYLKGSPELDSAMSKLYSRSQASAADQEARLKSDFGRAGMGFSTAHQQAAQNNRAAATANAGATEAAARLQNYQAERGYQNAAPQMLAQALGVPLDYLSQIPSAFLSPLLQEAQLVTGLATGGQTATPNTTVYKEEGIGNQVMKAVGPILGAAAGAAM
jgi:hypothetical protein